LAGFLLPVEAGVKKILRIDFTRGEDAERPRAASAARVRFCWLVVGRGGAVPASRSFQFMMVLKPTE